MTRPGKEGAEKLVATVATAVDIEDVALAVMHVRYWPDYARAPGQLAEVVYAEGSRNTISQLGYMVERGIGALTPLCYITTCGSGIKPL